MSMTIMARIAVKYSDVIPGEYIDQHMDTLQNAYMSIYNEFCNVVNPCLPIWNKAFNCTHEKFDEKEYGMFMMERYGEVIDSMIKNNPSIKALMPTDDWYICIDEDFNLHYGMKCMGFDAIDVILEVEKKEDPNGT